MPSREFRSRTELPRNTLLGWRVLRERHRRPRWILAFVALTILMSGCLPQHADPKRPGILVAVFAHPDDEIVAGPALSRYAAEGHEVHLITLTSGQVGDALTEIPRGDELGAAREDEARCSAAALGIREPVLLGFMDGDIAPWDGLPAIRSRLRQELRRLKPDVILTWGTDGLSGHTDHRIASALATEVYQEPWEDTPAPSKLYYATLPAPENSSPAVVIGDRATISPELVTTVIEAGEYSQRTLEAMHCHKTQWNPPEDVDRMFEERQEVLQGKVYFRLAMSRLTSTATPEDDLLAGIPR